MSNLITPLNIGLVSVAAVALLIINFWPQLSAWWNSRKTTTTATPPVNDDPDVLDMLALKRLTARYTNMKCPEGTAAMQTAAAHFFHETTGV